MMFTLLDHILTGAFWVFAIGAVIFVYDMARYVFGGNDE